MEFIKRLKHEDKLEELKNYLEANFAELNWKFKFKDFSVHNFILVYIEDEKGKELAYFNIHNFNCAEPRNLDPNCKYIHLYGRVRDLYLKFMKQTFPEYKNEYIKNLKLKLVKEVDEFISL